MGCAPISLSGGPGCLYAVCFCHRHSPACLPTPSPSPLPAPTPPSRREEQSQENPEAGRDKGRQWRVDAHPPHARVHALCPAFHGTGLAVAGSAQFSEAKWLTEVLRHFPPQFKFMTNKQTSTRSGDKESKAGPDAERQASKLRQAASPQGRQRTLLRSKSL